MGNLYYNQPELAGNKPITMVSLSSPQTISANTQTAVAFATVVYDPFGSYNVGTETYTAPWGGVYRVSATLLLSNVPTAAATPAVLEVIIQAAGGAVAIGELSENQSAGVAYINTVSVDILVPLTAGQTLSIRAFITPAGTCTVAASGTSTNFRVEYLQP